MPVRVRCKTCGVESEASANRLLCGECGDYHTELISGDEMVLTRLEFDT
jgi:hydrogenase nickel incorporation protein HypA/HybF